MERCRLKVDNEKYEKLVRNIPSLCVYPEKQAADQDGDAPTTEMEERKMIRKQLSILLHILITGIGTFVALHLALCLAEEEFALSMAWKILIPLLVAWLIMMIEVYFTFHILFQ
jgi:Endoplasmic reticulum-based factor for assembly of V-ATPase